jgi:plastocyanin
MLEVSMRRLMPIVVSTLLAVTVGPILPSIAGPEKIAFPTNYGSGVLYTVVDRYDIKQYRELYATPEAVAAVKAGKPIPSGTVLTLVQYKAQVDAQGTPIKDAGGRFVKGDLVAYAVMEKRTGWGTEYPDSLRNGEWEYAAFGANRALNEKANYKGCFECHKPHEKADFVISLPKIAGTTVAAAAPGTADVTIQGFAFGPATLAAAPGKQITWLNTDDSPHQIAIAGPQGQRSPLLLKGQRHTQAFATPGTYSYTCGLHPSMKGTIEVK